MSRTRLMTGRSYQYVAMPAGVIKGALFRLGFQATVTPEIISLPQCVYQSVYPYSVLSPTPQVHFKSNYQKEFKWNQLRYFTLPERNLRASPLLTLVAWELATEIYLMQLTVRRPGFAETSSSS